MPKEILEINSEKIDIRLPRTKDERIWFSYLAHKIEKCRFGKMTIELTVTNSQVTNIQNSIKESFSVHDASQG